MPGEETILARRQRLSLLPRACEACKIRKIRCDRSHPCGNCRSSGITCQQANAVPDTRPKSDRVAQLEEHVATLEARLAKVELRLGSADSTTSPLKPSSVSSSVSPAAGSLSEPQLHEVSPSGVSGLYEGSTSFLNQSVQASEVAQRTATSGTPEAAQNISESFSHLESLLHSGADLQTHRLSNDIASRSVPDITPLPAAVVIAVLRKLKSRPSLFISGHAVTDVPLVEYLCQRVYFPTESVSIGHVTSVSGILHLILREYEITQASLSDGWDLKQLVIQAGRNFDLGIESFELLTVPSFENLLALTLAVIRAQTETKPVLFRALLASACGHCQMLGYHRESTFQKDRGPHTENKRRIFWMLYVYDKSDSLLFGHTSKIQDFDIDARPPTPSSDPSQRPWDDLFCLGIGLSRVQGRIYDKLYSVTALQSPAVERKQSIDALTAELLKWRNDFDQWTGAGVHFVSMADLAKIHWDIIYYSTLTSLLRAPVTPGVGTDISSQCFQAARLGLHSHLRCFSGYGGANWVSRSEYVNWALHNSSFTPFVVIFLHSIAASSMDDVQLLDQVVETLESARNSQAGTERQYQICVTFARLARRMVEARNTCVGMYDQNTDSLQVAGVSEDVPLNWPEAFMQPSGQQVEPGGFSGFLDDDMSSILANWINGQPQATDMFGMEFGE